MQALHQLGGHSLRADHGHQLLLTPAANAGHCVRAVHGGTGHCGGRVHHRHSSGHGAAVFIVKFSKH